VRVRNIELNCLYSPVDVNMLRRKIGGNSFSSLAKVSNAIRGNVFFAKRGVPSLRNFHMKGLSGNNARCFLFLGHAGLFHIKEMVKE